MKKFLLLALALVLCLALFIACGETQTPETPDDQPGTEVTYDVNAAATYLFNLYKDKATTTSADFEVTSKLQVNAISYDVEWTATEGVTITKKTENTVLIDINEKTDAEYTYTLTATVKAADGTTATKTFTYTVPAYQLMTWEQYIATAAGETITSVEGVVTGIVSKSAGSSSNCLFVQDATGGAYYVYGMTKDPIADLHIEIGMTVAVSGTKDIYSGTHEIKDSSVTVISTEKTPVAPMDYTEIFANASSLTDAALVTKQSSLVTIKGVEISGQNLEQGYLYFKLADKEAYLRISGSTLAFPSSEKDAFIATHAEKKGWSADVTGIISIYNNAFYLVPVSVDAFNYLEKIEKTPAQMIEDELGALDIPTSIGKDCVVELPAAGTTYADVKFAWAIDTDAFTITDGKIDIKLGAAATTIKLTVTATCGEATATKEIEITVSANMVLSTTKPYIPSLFQAKLDGGKRLYLDGTFGERYLNMTDDPAKAVAVYAEVAEGGYKFYILDGETKCYVTIYKNDAGKDAVKYAADAGNVFYYDASVNAWVTTHNDTLYYLGTYNTFNTVSASKLSYITPENTGVEQFPLEYTPVVEGVAMNGLLFQAKLDGGKTLYLDGTFGERYLNMTDDVTKAVAIYAEKAEDGYKFYILVDGAKQYLYLYKNDAGKSAVKFDAENANVFKFDGATNAWTTVYDGGDYYLGTYNTFNTVSSSKTSYITAENTGVDQFPLNYVLAGGAAPENPEQGGEEPKPEDPKPAGKVTIAQALELADGTEVIIDAVVKIVNGAWNEQYGNMNITIEDETGTLYVFRISTKVEEGDKVTITGKMATYNEARQIAQGATAVITGKVEGGDAPEMPGKPTGTPVANFTFGDDGEAKHVDGNDLGETVSYTEGDYTLELTAMSKVYGPAFDATGKSCIKLGTGKVVGTFTFTVADGVNKVVIRVAAYKANAGKVVINGTEYDVSANKSNEGSYAEIVVDTSATKTVTFVTVEGAQRVMVDSIAYYAN